MFHNNFGNFLLPLFHPAEQAGGEDHPDHLQQGNTKAAQAHKVKFLSQLCNKPERIKCNKRFEFNKTDESTMFKVLKYKEIDFADEEYVYSQCKEYY